MFNLVKRIVKKETQKVTLKHWIMTAGRHGKSQKQHKRYMDSLHAKELNIFSIKISLASSMKFFSS